LPPIKGAEKRNIQGDDGNPDLTNTRDISQSALESDRALIKVDAKKKSYKGDIEKGKIQKNSKKVSPEIQEKVNDAMEE